MPREIESRRNWAQVSTNYLQRLDTHWHTTMKKSAENSWSTINSFVACSSAGVGRAVFNDGGMYSIHTSIHSILAGMYSVHTSPICIGMFCICIVCILNYNTCKYRLSTSTIQTTIHAQHEGNILYVLENIPIHTSMYWHVLCWYSNTCLFFLQYVPILTPIRSPIQS